MKAMIYVNGTDPGRFVLKEIEKPRLKGDEVLVKIYATSVNAADYRSIQIMSIPKSRIFGADIAGKVVEIGANAKKWRVGDEVLGDISDSGFGGFAEYVAVPEGKLVLKPEGMAFETAAAIPMAAVTALQALRDKGNIQKGQKVLICGASGGVGSFAVQLAKHFGSEATAVCGSGNIDLVRSFGADHIIDYSKEDFGAQNKKYDLIIAVHGNRGLLDYKKALDANGVFVVVGGSLAQVLKTMFFGPFITTKKQKMLFCAAKTNAADLEYVVKLAEQGLITPYIEKIYPLNELPAAMKYISGGHARGKLIISQN
jgi:2-desacetyl-2-hydroxyethyl bacteriochlorophyllide A dehydrogenase